jgi:hypothetical protein
MEIQSKDKSFSKLIYEEEERDRAMIKTGLGKKGDF